MSMKKVDGPKEKKKGTDPCMSKKKDGCMHEQKWTDQCGAMHVH